MHYHTVCISENRLGQTVQAGKQTLGHLELFSDGQTESLIRFGGPESWLRKQPTGLSHNKVAHIAHT